MAWALTRLVADRRVLLGFVLGLFYLVVVYSAYRPMPFMIYTVVFLGLIVALSDPRTGWLCLLLGLLLYDDTPRILALRGTDLFHSLFIASVLPISPLSLWLAGLLGITAVWWLAAGARRRLAPFDRPILLIACLCVVAAAVGLRNVSSWPRMYWEDFRYFIHIFLGYFVVTTFFRTKANLEVLVKFLATGFVVMVAAGYGFAAFGFGQPVPGMVRPFFDSSRMLLGVLVVVCMSVLLNVSCLNRREALRHWLVVAMTAGMICLQFTRMHVVLTVVSLLILVALSVWSWSRGSPRVLLLGLARLTTVAASTALGLALLVSVLVDHAPEALAYLEARWESTIAIFQGVTKMESVDLSADIRLISLANIWATLGREGSCLWGQGLGGGFTDDYRRFPEELYVTGLDAFSKEEIESGFFARPGGNELWILLKTGLIGILVYYGFAATVFWRGVQYALRATDKRMRALVLGIISSFPILFWQMFTPKLQVMLGVLLGVLAVILSVDKRSLQGAAKGVEAPIGGSGAGPC